MAVKEQSGIGITEVRALLAGTGMEPLSERAIGQFVDQGMPKMARGRYDPDVCVGWYLARLRNLVHAKRAESSDGDPQSLLDAQTRWTRAKAENEEMTARERRGDLMPLSLYVTETAKLITVVKQKLLNLPSRLAPRLEGLTGPERKALMTAAVKELLTNLAHSGDEKPTLPKKRGRRRTAQNKR